MSCSIRSDEDDSFLQRFGDPVMHPFVNCIYFRAVGDLVIFFKLSGLVPVIANPGHCVGLKTYRYTYGTTVSANLLYLISSNHSIRQFSARKCSLLRYTCW